MRARPVLVTAASRHGSTAKIAAAIHSQISRAGFDVDLVNPKILHDVTGYRAVIVGSPLYGGRWMSAARKFVERHDDALRERPVWLFSAGVNRPPVEGEASPDVAHLVGLSNANGHEFFAGKLDRAALRLTERALLHRVGVNQGDYRDWSHISEWTSGICESLNQYVTSE